MHERIAEIKSRLEAVKSAPWSACGEGGHGDKGICCLVLVTIGCSTPYKLGHTVGSSHYPVAKVTHGEWGDEYPAIRFIGDEGIFKATKAEAYMERIGYGEVNAEEAKANLLLIAHAPEDIKFLLDYIAQLEGKK